MAAFLYDWVISPLWWLHANWGTFGDIVDIVLVVGFFMLVGWWLLPIVVGVVASGGAFSALAHWFGRQLQPLIRLGLKWKFGDAENGLHIVGREWVGKPWDPQAKQGLDLILIGVKLRRRGLK